MNRQIFTRETFSSSRPVGDHITFAPAYDRSTLAVLVLAIAALCSGLFVLVYGIDNGIADPSSFRQTQTALSAYWLAREPHTFAYLTPVLGYPWSMPFEYPVYQWLVVLLMKTGIPLVPAGRIVSFAAFVGCLVPLRMMARDFKISDRSFLIAATVFLASPYYIYWSRTLMIETTALLFSLCWLAGFFRGRASPGTFVWSATICCGIIACLAKSTTFLGVGVVGGMVFVYDFVACLKRRGDGWKGLLAVALAGIIPLIVGSGWVMFTDMIKSANPYSFILTSSAMTGWNLGTLAQRLLLTDPILLSLRQTFGFVGLFVILFVALDLVASRYRAVILGAVAAYFIPFLLFSNLHIVHDYYQLSSAVFICVAAGLTIGSLIDKGWIKIGIFALMVLVASQVYFFQEKYWHYIVNDNIQDPVVLTARAAREATNENESILFFGDDWSSVVPFYSERKSLGVSWWTYPALFDQIITDPQSRLGPARLGAIIDCRQPPQWQTYQPDQMAKIDNMLANRQKLFESGRCRLFSARTDPTNDVNPKAQ